MVHGRFFRRGFLSCLACSKPYPSLLPLFGTVVGMEKEADGEPGSRPSSFFEEANPLRSPPQASSLKTSPLALDPGPSTQWQMRAGTEDERSLAPVYRFFFLVQVAAPIPSAMMMIFNPHQPVWEFLSLAFFAPSQACVSLYLVSRLNGEMGITEKLCYGLLVLQVFAIGLHTALLSEITLTIVFFGYGLFYGLLYKVLRRLRKRLLRLESITSYISKVFTRGIPSLVPIFYLSAESLGCLQHEAPSGQPLHLVWSSDDFEACRETVSANHAMSFHLSMLMCVSLFILPFEDMQQLHGQIIRFDLR